MEATSDRNGLTDFIRQRLSERYIAPLQAVPRKKKHGFLMVASACLLIETLESFYQGWDRTDQGIPRRDILDACKPADSKRSTVSAGEIAFCYFFQREPAFSSLRPHAHDFYVHVRCGILHQGETTGGWQIQRKKEDADLFDNPCLNANRFLAEVEKALSAYADRLRSAAWDDDIWKNFRNKMDATIEHCRP